MDAPFTSDGSETGLETGLETTSSVDSKYPHWFALLVPIAIAVAVSFFSPNFQPGSNVAAANEEVVPGVPQRNSPLGADFLQEYVGGYIFGSEERDKLYEPQHFQAVEHDAELLGFGWPEDEYFPMVYPPFYYAATRVLSSLGESGIGYLWTARGWLWLSGIAISLSGFLLHRFYAPSRTIVSTGLIASIIFVPMLHNFNLGQKGGFLLLILSGTFVLLHNNRKLSAGLLFGLIAFKPHLGLTIGLVMLFKRQWRFCLGAVATVALLTGVSYWGSPTLWHDYVGVVMGMQDYVGTAGYELAESHSFWGALELMLGTLAPSMVKPLAVLLSVGLVGLVLRITWPQVSTCSPAFALQFSSMVIAMVMLSPHFYTYDLTILLLPIVLITSLNRGAAVADPSRDRSLSYSLLGLFGLAGIFPKIAALTGVQLSIPLMLFVLSIVASRSAQSPFAPHSRLSLRESSDPSSPSHREGRTQ